MLQPAPPTPSAALQAGLALFQSGSPYAAHEAWEAVWLQLPESPLREGVRGLIQLAVVAAHLQRDPSRRARLAGLLQRAEQRLADPAVRFALQQAGLGAAPDLRVG